MWPKTNKAWKIQQKLRNIIKSSSCLHHASTCQNETNQTRDPAKEWQIPQLPRSIIPHAVPSLLILPLIQADTNSSHQGQVHTRGTADKVCLAIRNQLPEIHEAPRNSRDRAPTETDLRRPIEPVALQIQRDGCTVGSIREADFAFA